MPGWVLRASEEATYPARCFGDDVRTGKSAKALVARTPIGVGRANSQGQLHGSRRSDDLRPALQSHVRCFLVAGSRTCGCQRHVREREPHLGSHTPSWRRGGCWPESRFSVTIEGARAPRRARRPAVEMGGKTPFAAQQPELTRRRCLSHSAGEPRGSRLPLHAAAGAAGRPRDCLAGTGGYRETLRGPYRRLDGRRRRGAGHLP